MRLLCFGLIFISQLFTVIPFHRILLEEFPSEEGPIPLRLEQSLKFVGIEHVNSDQDGPTEFYTQTYSFSELPRHHPLPQPTVKAIPPSVELNKSPAPFVPEKPPMVKLSETQNTAIIVEISHIDHIWFSLSEAAVISDLYESVPIEKSE